ncbi:tellurite resistance TerB family protein [Gayadomonas joobiniege]|uniref:tellurite resistance TerB family protein n=1 Tax=Gayadomonas joobiniege TaxID=1234606 RepID=UPI000365FD81|nr:tellurite resistance TerB family protein [Gayadomonas joobiniege]
MSFFDKVKSTFSQGRESLMKEVSKFKNAEFMEATVSACALIAYADGEVSAAEKQKMMGFIQNSEELQHFDTQKVIDVFNKVISKLEFDMEIGKAEALRTIGKVSNKPEQARLVIRVAIAIANSDGEFDNSEKAMVREICVDLGLNPAEFGV